MAKITKSVNSLIMDHSDVRKLKLKAKKEINKRNFSKAYKLLHKAKMLSLKKIIYPLDEFYYLSQIKGFKCDIKIPPCRKFAIRIFSIDICIENILTKLYEEELKDTKDFNKIADLKSELLRLRNWQFKSITYEIFKEKLLGIKLLTSKEYQNS